jgi:4-hydroxybenzoate polyprenyltransferase
MPFAMIGFSLGLYQVLQTPGPADVSFKHVAVIFFLILICMITARNAAMAFNRFIDRKYDEKNPRTAIREIPSGMITPQNALVFVFINVAIFVTATFFINKICFYLSPIALAVILGYSLTKRFTFLCHLILGIGLGLAPIGAFLAVTGQFEIVPVAFSFAVFFWVSGFDIIYALQDEQFDKDHQLYSIPSFFGQDRAKWIARFLHAWSFGIIIYIGIHGHFSFLYWLGSIVFGGLLLYQHYIVYRFGLDRINLAFFTMNGIASILFGLCVITDIIMHL